MVKLEFKIFFKSEWVPLLTNFFIVFILTNELKVNLFLFGKIEVGTRLILVTLGAPPVEWVKILRYDVVLPNCIHLGRTRYN